MGFISGINSNVYPKIDYKKGFELFEPIFKNIEIIEYRMM